MGNLLRLLSRDDNPKYDVFVDFENAQPTDIEREAYEMVDEVLQYSKDVLLELQTYKGAVNEIREAITNPRNESYQTRAWEAVLPLVSKLKRFYEFSQQIDDVVPRILWQLCSGPLPPAQHLRSQQALVKQFAEILDFVLKFDDLKMTNPAIQNDFSYYRRTVSRLRLANQEPIDEELEVPNELANKMSLFYAHATPMLKVLSDATMRFVAENKDLPIENTTETLGTMAKVCQRMIENREFCSRFRNEETILFVLRVMVGLIILYDHVHPVGAFAKSAHIDVKGSIKVLKDQPPNVVEGLLNALRASGKYLTIRIRSFKKILLQAKKLFQKESHEFSSPSSVSEGRNVPENTSTPLSATKFKAGKTVSAAEGGMNRAKKDVCADFKVEMIYGKSSFRRSEG